MKDFWYAYDQAGIMEKASMISAFAIVIVPFVIITSPLWIPIYFVLWIARGK
jgi:hypothetical protein